MAGKKNVKKKVRKAVSHGKCFVQAGFGNTIITMTDLTGETIAWSSSGHLGFKGSRKGTPFASQMAAEDVSKKAMEAGLRSVDIYLKGPGAGREPALRAIASAGIRVATMSDTTPVPHHGCRPPKRIQI